MIFPNVNEPLFLHNLHVWKSIHPKFTLQNKLYIFELAQKLFQTFRNKKPLVIHDDIS